MLFKELTHAESIPDIIIFVRFNKYNWKVDIEIKILEPLEAFLIYNKKSICFLRLENPHRIKKYNIKIKILELIEALLI